MTEIINKAQNLAIYYHPDGFDTNRQKIMGRHAAGEEFLKALSYWTRSEKLSCYAKNKQDALHFMQKISNASKSSSWIKWGNLQGLAEIGSLFSPGPNPASLAYQRTTLDATAFSL